MQTLVIAANGAHARFFTMPETQLAANESGPHLVELETFINPERETTGSALWSDNTGGRSGTPGGAHGYDDHREQHRMEYERRFAAMVAKRAIERMQGMVGANLIITAEKRMLGLLRDVIAGRHDFTVREMAKNFCKVSPAELQGHLVKAGLLPPVRKPAM